MKRDLLILRAALTLMVLANGTLAEKREFDDELLDNENVDARMTIKRVERGHKQLSLSTSTAVKLLRHRAKSKHSGKLAKVIVSKKRKKGKKKLKKGATSSTAASLKSFTETSFTTLSNMPSSIMTSTQQAMANVLKADLDFDRRNHLSKYSPGYLARKNSFTNLFSPSAPAVGSSSVDELWEKFKEERQGWKLTPKKYVECLPDFRSLHARLNSMRRCPLPWNIDDQYNANLPYQQLPLLPNIYRSPEYSDHNLVQSFNTNGSTESSPILLSRPLAKPDSMEESMFYFAEHCDEPTTRCPTSLSPYACYTSVTPWHELIVNMYHGTPPIIPRYPCIPELEALKKKYKLTATVATTQACQ